MTKEERDKLLKIGEEIRQVIDDKQKELELSFVEDTHTYFIKNEEGYIVSNFPSVSTVIMQFYDGFPEFEKSLDMSDGDIFKQDELLKQWRTTADYANSKGSRVHYLLEMDLLKQYGSYKDVRKPIFDCDEEQIKVGNQMIEAGHDFIRLMHRRGAVLLDTEMVLGSARLKYTGQPDKVWIMFDKNGVLGFIITDWKTNKPKNMEVQHYTTPMLPPFEEHMDTALSHYKIQIPLYGRLILDMLKGTKYEDMKFFGGVIVHLLEGRQFKEFRIENAFVDQVLTMNPLPRIDEILEYKEGKITKEANRLNDLAEARLIKSEYE